MDTVLGIFPFIAACFAADRVNWSKEKRSRQFSMPIWAVIYCMITMFAVDQIAVKAILIIDMIRNLLEAVPFVGSWLEEIVSALELGHGVEILANTSIMAGFCVFKRLVFYLQNVIRRWSDIVVKQEAFIFTKTVLEIEKKLGLLWNKCYQFTAKIFYEEDGSRKVSVLKECFADMRSMFCAVYGFAAVMGTLTQIWVWKFQGTSGIQLPCYPVFGIIVLGEIYFYLSGETSRESQESKKEKKQDAKQIDFSVLRKMLKEKFVDCVIYDSDITYQKPEKEVQDWIETFKESEDQKEQIAAAYFEQYKENGNDINNDYVNVSSKLMHGQSILIHNPFYRDLTPYLMLPLFHELLNHRSCLIISGRIANDDDVYDWISNGVQDAANLKKLWKIDFLDKPLSQEEKTDIGILSFKNLYDLSNLSANETFFKTVGFIILLEPSNLLGTGQVGLRCVLQMCENEQKTITYCALDRNSDGLVDALSHAIRQSIVEVVASPSPQNGYSQMFWNVDGPGVQNRILPNISRYLGFGGDIGCYAIAKGTSQVHWYSSSKMPLTDLRWSMGQYYRSICNYIRCVPEQAQLDRCFLFHNTLWQAEFGIDAFVIVEDEFCNMFEMARTFATRIRKKGFINILCENYMLRDYMVHNPEIFQNDPKAVPSIVPDYVRTERNFVFRTMMMMAAAPLEETLLHQELLLHGCTVKDVHAALCTLIKRYTDLEPNMIQVIYQDEEDTKCGKVITHKFFGMETSVVTKLFDSALRSAFYVVENEKYERYYMGNRLMGHIEQTLLPGQYFCYEGKYYEVCSISHQNGIIVRRAADHLVGRRYYRQFRRYQIKFGERQKKHHNFRGLKIETYLSDIQVQTDGYLDLKSINRFDEANTIRLEEPVVRTITNKTILKLQLEDAAPKVCYTLCVLLNELFRTIYPNEFPYLAAVTTCMPQDTDEGQKDLKSGLLYSLSLDSEKDQEAAIYFVEDSCIDLGLLVSCERNLQRFLEILADYLEWYLKDSTSQEEKTEDADELEDPNELGEMNAPEHPGKPVLLKRKSILEKIKNFFQRVIHRKKKKSERKQKSDEMFFDAAAEQDVDGEDEQLINSGVGETCEKEVPYLTFGFEEVPSCLKLEETLEYLKKYGFHDSNLRRARKKTNDFDEGSDYDPNEPGTHYCDFCGCVLKPGEYDVLKDGRERCPECGKEAVKTGRFFKKIYKETIKEMEEIFDIQIDCPIQVRMVNAKKVNEHSGTYKPSPRSDGRILGYAESSKDGYKIYLENGAPRWNTKTTLVHELTHIWQYCNWDGTKLQQHYPKNDQRLITCEGMAVWAEIQYLISMGETERAIRYKRNREAEANEYGIGMIKYLNRYPVQTEGKVKKKYTPFGHFPPI